jgi:hypothetical protein
MVFMKKILLIIMGLIMVSSSTYLAINYITTMKRVEVYMKSRGGEYARFEKGIVNGEIATAIIMLIGIITLVWAYRLKKQRNLAVNSN